MPDEVKALFEGAVDSDENRHTIVNFSSGNRLSPVWLDWMVERSRITTTPAAFAGYLTAWSEGNFGHDIMGDKTPMLVAVGEHDAALNAELMRQTYLVFHPNAELEIIPNAGHYPMQETPVYLATIIERFLARHA
jgi:pimeloyl-ACP methyl ester carboxylesterase